jgi:hypothetical protein
MSSFDQNIIPSASSDCWDNTFAPLAYAHQAQKGKYSNYNYANYMFPIDNDKSNLSTYNSVPRQTDIKPKNSFQSNISSFVDFDLPQTMGNTGMIYDMVLHLTLNNPTSSTANLCNAGYFFNKIQILKGGNNDISNQILNDVIYLENCWSMKSNTKTNRHLNLGMDTTNLNYTSLNTIAAGQSRDYYLRIPYNWTNTYYLRDAISQTITFRLTWASNINVDTVVLTNQLVVQNMTLRVHSLEIDNMSYNSLLAQPYLDYRIYRKGNSAQSFAIQCQAGVSQQFQINSVSGDCAGILVYITPALRDVSPCVYDTFYPISSIQLVNQSNASLTNNVVPITSAEMVDYAVMNSNTDFWTYKNIYLIPFSTSFTDCVLNNKINGAIKLPQPTFKVSVTPSVTQANCTLTVLAYTIGFLRVNYNASTTNEFSTG